MTLVQMKYFSAVCKTLNFTKASALLHVTQPAISAAIRELEQECGVILFHREKNTLTLTAEGAVLLESIQPLLIQYDQLMHTVNDLHLERRFVRVGFATVASCIEFSEILTAFHAVHPDIVVEAVEKSNRDLNHFFETDQLDVIFTSVSSISDNDAELYHKRVVGRNHQVFCVNAHHPLVNSSFVDIETIARQPLVLTTSRFQAQAARILQLAEEKGLSLNVIHYTDQIYTVERFIENGTACGFLSDVVAARNPYIVGIPYDGNAHSGEVIAYWKRSQFRPQAVELFTKVIIERAKTIPQQADK